MKIKLDHYKADTLHPFISERNQLISSRKSVLREFCFKFYMRPAHVNRIIGSHRKYNCKLLVHSCESSIISKLHLQETNNYMYVNKSERSAPTCTCIWHGNLSRIGPLFSPFQILRKLIIQDCNLWLSCGDTSQILIIADALWHIIQCHPKRLFLSTCIFCVMYTDQLKKVQIHLL